MCDDLVEEAIRDIIRSEAIREATLSLGELRNNPHVPRDALAEIEKAHEEFLHHCSAEPEIALQAYSYGLVMGAYLELPEALAEAERLRQSMGGKLSGQKRLENRAWTEHAKELALQLRKEDPSLSQDRVATEIEATWKLADVECPVHTTLTGYISSLEKEGKLPKRQPKL